MKNENLIAEIERLQGRNDALEDLIHRIKNWCQAYPVDIFAEPDLEAVKAALRDRGILNQMDRMHASWGRHILSGLGKILGEDFMSDQPARAAFYFGCIGRAGHYLHDKDGRTIHDEKKIGSPWTVQLMDTGLLNNGRHPDRCDGKVYWTCGKNPAGFWFAFFWWDRSVDSRGGSNSGFYVSGFQSDQIDQAFAFACQCFPIVVSRQKFNLVLQHKATAHD